MLPDNLSEQDLNTVFMQNLQNINATNSNGTTLLQAAFNQDNLDLAKKLINSLAEVNNANNKGYTALNMVYTIEGLEVLLTHPKLDKVFMLKYIQQAEIFNEPELYNHFLTHFREAIVVAPELDQLTLALFSLTNEHKEIIEKWNQFSAENNLELCKTKTFLKVLQHFDRIGGIELYRDWEPANPEYYESDKAKLYGFFNRMIKYLDNRQQLTQCREDLLAFYKGSVFGQDFKYNKDLTLGESSYCMSLAMLIPPLTKGDLPDLATEVLSYIKPVWAQVDKELPNLLPLQDFMAEYGIKRLGFDARYNSETVYQFLQDMVTHCQYYFPFSGQDFAKDTLEIYIGKLHTFESNAILGSFNTATNLLNFKNDELFCYSVQDYKSVNSEELLATALHEYTHFVQTRACNLDFSSPLSQEIFQLPEWQKVLNEVYTKEYYPAEQCAKYMVNQLSDFKLSPMKELELTPLVVDYFTSDNLEQITSFLNSKENCQDTTIMKFYPTDILINVFAQNLTALKEIFTNQSKTSFQFEIWNKLNIQYKERNGYDNYVMRYDEVHARLVQEDRFPETCHDHIFLNGVDKENIREKVKTPLREFNKELVNYIKQLEKPKVIVEHRKIF